MTAESIRKPAKEAIESRAYQRYLERGARDGNDLADWLEAERELTEAIFEPMAQPAPATTTKSVKRDVAAA